MIKNKLTSKPKRPIGISIISFLYLASGGFIAAMYIFTPSVKSDTGYTIYDVLGLLITVMMFVAAFGLSMGKKWGWWIISIISFNNLLLDIRGLYEVTDITLSNDPNFYLHNIAALVFHILILVYLFQKNVFEYFGFNPNIIFKKIGLVIVLSAGLFLVFYLMGFL